MSDTVPLLTRVRLSLWDAIENWPATASAFNRKFRFDDDQPDWQDIDPGMQDLPAIAIVPVNMDPDWIHNQIMNWPTAYKISIWTPHYSLSLPERLVEETLKGLFESTPTGGSVPYVKQASGYYPMPLGPVAFHPIHLADGDEVFPCILTEINVTIRANKNPFTK